MSNCRGTAMKGEMRLEIWQILLGSLWCCQWSICRLNCWNCCFFLLFNYDFLKYMYVVHKEFFRDLIYLYICVLISNVYPFIIIMNLLHVVHECRKCKWWCLFFLIARTCLLHTNLWYSIQYWTVMNSFGACIFNKLILLFFE